MITTVVDDKDADYQQTGVIAEGARIPIRSIRTTEKGVKFYKFGGGFEFTYEFERRASLDIVTPYAARMQREVEIGEVAIATGLIIKDRKSVVKGKSVSVRVDLGGGRIINKTKKHKHTSTP